MPSFREIHKSRLLHTQARIQRGDLGIYSPSIFWKCKLIQMFKLVGKKRLALKFSQEIRTETRISNINLQKTKKTRLALKFSQDIRTETRFSNFNLKGGLVRNIYVWGEDISGEDLFRIIYLKGDMFCIFSWREILFRSTDSSFYLFNQFDCPKMT